MIKRLLPEDDLSWKLYPQMENRVRAFSARYDLSYSIDALLYEMRLRWLQFPQLSGYWVDLQKGCNIDGHLVAWVHNVYGQNKAFVYQAEGDGLHDRHLWWAALQNWVAGLNERLSPELRIHKAEWSTWHSPELWKRYLSNVTEKDVKVRHVIEADLN